MMDKDGSIDLSLENLWHTWTIFRKGKKPSPELDEFEYHLEGNLFQLHQDLNSGAYRHGSYRTFTVCDNKRREISVAPIRDRIVHRLIYDYLPKSDEIFKISHGLRFLGMVIKHDERNLNRRNRKRVKSRMNYKNIGSYYGLVKKHAELSFGHEFDWRICELLKRVF